MTVRPYEAGRTPGLEDGEEFRAAFENLMMAVNGEIKSEITAMTLSLAIRWLRVNPGDRDVLLATAGRAEWGIRLKYRKRVIAQPDDVTARRAAEELADIYRTSVTVYQRVAAGGWKAEDVVKPGAVHTETGIR